MYDPKLYCGDCLEVMKTIPDNHIDMVFCDLPYGTTHNKWDVIISKQSFLQYGIHFLLTQRKVENFKNNIKDELSKIEIIKDKKSNK